MMALMIDLDKNEQSADRRAAWTALVFTAMAMGWNAAQARLPEGKRITEQSPIGKWISFKGPDRMEIVGRFLKRCKANTHTGQPRAQRLLAPRFRFCVKSE